MAISGMGGEITLNISKSLALLKTRDKRKFILLTLLQGALSLLDLVSVAIVGIIASIAVNGVNQLKPGRTSSKILELVHLQNFPIQTQATVLSTAVGFFLIAKSFSSMYLNRRLMYFLSYRSANVSRLLVGKLVKQSALVIESKSAQELIYSATTGVNAIVVGVLGNFSSLVGDFILCAVLGVGLFIYSPVTTIFTFLVLGSILAGLFRYLNSESVRLTSSQTRIGLENANLLAELVENYRESIVRNRRGFYSKSIGELRDDLAGLTAKQNWLPNISKYVIEMTVTSFTLLLAFLQFRSLDAVHAVGSLAIFLVAGARLAPSLLRMQQFLIAMNSNSAAAGPTFTLFDNMKRTQDQVSHPSSFSILHNGFKPEIEVQNLEFEYPGSGNLRLEIANLKISAGEFVAVVGPSGSGKSTLVDLILGILEPQKGVVKISNESPESTFSDWPGAVAYVSQRTSFPTGTIRTCISGGYEEGEIDSALIWRSLEKAGLSEYVDELPLGIDEPLGERAVRMSGGQRQRLSIARALLTEPMLLVMDEATSSLDSATEEKVSRSIQELKGDVTLLVVAHRLSTVRMADRILYMESGKIIAQGTFEQLKIMIPNFNRQASLMGL